MTTDGKIRSKYAIRLLKLPIGKRISVRSQIIFDCYRVAAARHGILIRTEKRRSYRIIIKIGMKELRPRAVDPRVKAITHRMPYK
jgi:hypothetical protein